MTSATPAIENTPAPAPAPAPEGTREHALSNVEAVLEAYEQAEATLEKIRQLKHAALGEFLAKWGPQLRHGRAVTKGNGGFRVLGGGRKST